MEKTLVFIKPNCIRKKCIGEIINKFEKNNLKIIGIKTEKLEKDEAENLYYMHRGKPFFFDLVKFMISGLCVFITLEGENIINKAGKLI